MHTVGPSIGRCGVSGVLCGFLCFSLALTVARKALGLEKESVVWMGMAPCASM